MPEDRGLTLPERVASLEAQRAEDQRRADRMETAFKSDIADVRRIVGDNNEKLDELLKRSARAGGVMSVFSSISSFGTAILSGAAVAAIEFIVRHWPISSSGTH